MMRAGIRALPALLTNAPRIRQTAGMANIVVGARGDVSDINGLYAQVGWSEPGGIRSRDRYLLAREDRRLIGAVLFWFDDEVDLLPDVWVQRFGRVERASILEIVVASSHRRKGTGRMLLVAAARSALERGITYLYTWPSPRGNENEVQGRLNFFKSCSMEILNEDVDHVVAVGCAAAVANCGSKRRPR
jgi:GNAT superfamily N-acetyltransferase